MKFYLLLILIISNNVIAASNLIVLTSFTTNNIEIDLEKYQYIEKRFNSAFPKNAVNISYIHRASGNDLHNALTKRKNSPAIIWIGHGASGNKLNNRFRTEDTILDVNGLNIAHLFSKYRSTLQFLGLVSCNLKSMINKIPNTNPIPFISSNNKTISLEKGIDKVLLDLKSNFDDIDANSLYKKSIRVSSGLQRQTFNKRNKKRKFWKNFKILNYSNINIKSERSLKNNFQKQFSIINLPPNNHYSILVNGNFIDVIQGRESTIFFNLPEKHLKTSRNIIRLIPLNPNHLDLSNLVIVGNNQTFTPFVTRSGKIIGNKEVLMINKR